MPPIVCVVWSSCHYMLHALGFVLCSVIVQVGSRSSQLYGSYAVCLIYKSPEVQVTQA